MPDGSGPPFDRSLALACHVRTLRDHWLKLRCCGGGTTLLPLGLVDAADNRTLADVVMRLRCRHCGARPATIVLVENPQTPSEAYGPPPTWELPLTRSSDPATQS